MITLKSRLTVDDIDKLKNEINSQSLKLSRAYLATHNTDGDIKVSDRMKKKLATKSLNESSMLIDEFSISDNEKLKVYWDKNDGYVVEKIYNQGNDLWRTDFKKTFHDELSAKRYFSRAKKKFSVNESVEDKKIYKFELTDDYLNSIHNLFHKAGEYFKNNPDKNEFEFEFDIGEFRNKIPHFSDKQLNDLAWDYYNDMVDFTRSNLPKYSMNNRNKKYGDTKEVAFDKIIVVVKNKEYGDEENHLDESLYDDDYFKAESEVDGWAQSDADYEKKKAYNDFYEEVLDFGISRKYIDDLYDYYIKRYDYWHKEIYESMCKESVDDDASYNWLSEVIDRDVKFHYTDGGYTIQFESEKDYKKAKNLADKHNFKGGKWFDEDLQFCDYNSTRVGMDYED